MDYRKEIQELRRHAERRHGYLYYVLDAPTMQRL